MTVQILTLTGLQPCLPFYFNGEALPKWSNHWYLPKCIELVDGHEVHYNDFDEAIWDDYCSYDLVTLEEDLAQPDKIVEWEQRGGGLATIFALKWLLKCPDIALQNVQSWNADFGVAPELLIANIQEGLVAMFRSTWQSGVFVGGCGENLEEKVKNKFDELAIESLRIWPPKMENGDYEDGSAGYMFKIATQIINDSDIENNNVKASIAAIVAEPPNIELHSASRIEENKRLDDNPKGVSA